MQFRILNPIFGRKIDKISPFRTMLWVLYTSFQHSPIHSLHRPTTVLLVYLEIVPSNRVCSVVVFVGVSFALTTYPNHLSFLVLTIVGSVSYIQTHKREHTGIIWSCFEEGGETQHRLLEAELSWRRKGHISKTIQCLCPNMLWKYTDRRDAIIMGYTNDSMDRATWVM